MNLSAPRGCPYTENTQPLNRYPPTIRPAVSADGRRAQISLNCHYGQQNKRSMSDHLFANIFPVANTECFD
jgi:hypothetical protein